MIHNYYEVRNKIRVPDIIEYMESVFGIPYLLVNCWVKMSTTLIPGVPNSLNEFQCVDRHRHRLRILVV